MARITSTKAETLKPPKLDSFPFRLKRQVKVFSQLLINLSYCQDIVVSYFYELKKGAALYVHECPEHKSCFLSVNLSLCFRLYRLENAFF